MQITLVESELKQAITEYLGRQMKIAEGMEMEIQLFATRGDAGFKATIDIRAVSPIKTPYIASEAKVSESPIRQQPFIVANTTRSPEPGVAQEEDSGEKAPFVGSTSIEETSAPIEAQGDATASAEAHPAVANESAPTASAGRSLFKGLGKPKNA